MSLASGPNTFASIGPDAFQRVGDGARLLEDSFCMKWR
jgi:hypothetical protein